MLEQLKRGISALQLQLSSHQINQLESLLNDLLKWNKAYNLTAIKDPQEALRLHILDSLAVLPYWQKFNKTLDVGTGAGFPGLPLAIALPQQEFHLLDSNSKKIRFIRQQIHALDLPNVTAHHSRIEDHPNGQYDCVTSRAFASLADMLTATQHQLVLDGRWMALKGVYSEQEVKAMPCWAEQVSYHSLDVPNLAAERCIIEIAKRND
ncbi:16S rRNA (guanine(527)-N(7))-methyltransferase RsmG [Aliikangiella sp. IMCC44653]